jgi:hypothetical protein
MQTLYLDIGILKGPVGVVAVYVLRELVLGLRDVDARDIGLCMDVAP